MAIVTPSARFVLTGTAGTNEIFATGFWATLIPPSTQNEADNFTGLIANTLAAQTQWSQLLDLMGTDTAFTKVQGYFYNTNASRADFLGEAPIASGTGTSAANQHPLQVSVVASLHTNTPGRSFRGRMYLPVNAVALGTRQMASGPCETVSGLLAGTFTDLRANTAPVTPVVMSSTKGLATEITAVSCNSVMDIQRRRANRQTPLFNITAPVQ